MKRYQFKRDDCQTLTIHKDVRTSTAQEISMIRLVLDPRVVSALGRHGYRGSRAMSLNHDKIISILIKEGLVTIDTLESDDSKSLDVDTTIPNILT